jgi:polyisoprenoid-binding protein YceI
MTQLDTERGMVRVPPGRWNVDPAHSTVGFTVKHLMISTVRGQFREFQGTIEAAEDGPEYSNASGSVNVAAIDTGNPDRDAHLRSTDFFDAERYPEIRYESTRIQHIEDGRYLIAGNLTIKGVTREVEMHATVDGVAKDPWGVERVGISVRGSIDRTDFGLTWQQKLAAGGLLVGEDVSVEIDVSAVRV